MRSYRYRSRVLMNTAWTAVQWIMNKQIAFHTKCVLTHFAYVHLCGKDRKTYQISKNYHHHSTTVMQQYCHQENVNRLYCYHHRNSIELKLTASISTGLSSGHSKCFQMAESGSFFYAAPQEIPSCTSTDFAVYKVWLFNTDL